VTSYHPGVDLAAPLNAPVAAAAAGRVVYAGPLVVRGNSVMIDHGAGVISGYHHLTDVTVQTGQMVNAGDVVGHVGSTGLSEAPHLHWEVVVRGITVDPMPWTQTDFSP
jgi:murein DD-endopeptidase MepM/ murein hydrolase activator NlpD